VRFHGERNFNDHIAYHERKKRMSKKTSSAHPTGVETVGAGRWSLLAQMALDLTSQRLVLSPEQLDTLLVLETLRPNVVSYVDMERIQKDITQHNGVIIICSVPRHDQRLRVHPSGAMRLSLPQPADSVSVGRDVPTTDAANENVADDDEALVIRIARMMHGMYQPRVDFDKHIRASRLAVETVKKWVREERALDDEQR
jgi:hypothetical protein